METNKVSKVLIWSLVILIVLGGIVYGFLKLNIINPESTVKESAKEDKIELESIKVGTTSLIQNT